MVGIVGFGWLELVYSDRDVPHTLALIAIGYATVQLVCMSIWGIERWTRRGDAFAVLFGFYARLSPLQVSDGVLELRRPLSGAPGLDLLPGTIAALCAAIGVTAFDGFSSGPTWISAVAHLQSGLQSLGAGPQTALEIAGTLGLLAAIGVVGAFFLLGARGMRFCPILCVWSG